MDERAVRATVARWLVTNHAGFLRTPAAFAAAGTAAARSQPYQQHYKQHPFHFVGHSTIFYGFCGTAAILLNAKVSIFHTRAEKKEDTMAEMPHILVAPLDWGLGHATRCIPLVRGLLAAGARVTLAAEGSQAALLQAEFPQLPLLPLPGYRIRFSRYFNLATILAQTPRLQRCIAAEHQWLQGQQAQHHFDAVISDNRYGLWTPHCPSILLTHQLQPAMPWGLGWAQAQARRRFYNWIENFDACWVPDVADATYNLSGLLGHPPELPNLPVHYIGPLSRLEPPARLPAKKYTLLMLLSGPEPQRSLLEQRLLAQAEKVEGTHLLVRGLPATPGAQLAVPHNVVAIPHMAPAMLADAMLSAEYVLSRGGYSTLMDVARLGGRNIIVPTPGQTEQYYLAQRWQAAGMAVAGRQRGLRLARLLALAQQHAYPPPSWPTAAPLQPWLLQWLNSLTGR